LDMLHAGIRDYFPLLLLIGCCGLGYLLLCGAVLRRQQVLRFRWFPVALGLLICGGYLSPPLNDLLRSVRGGVARVEGAQLWEHFGELREARPRAVFTGSRRPNVVLIYAESLEQRFFDETLFPGLLPHLQRLVEQSTAFADVAQGVGAGWTIAGMVASQCGYPLAPSHEVGGNDLSLFEDFLPKATCLGDILSRDGYQLTFMGGADARFAGKGAFLRSHGYTQIIDRDILLESLADPAYVHGWGIFDDTLFERAYDQFLRLSRQQTPFLLTLLTLDTHNPNGFLSSSCGNYGTGDNSFLNSVHCSDLLLSRFIERIRNSPDSDSTIIIVLSDHLALRNRATPLLERSQQPSRLLFLVNSPEGKKGVNANPGLHYDIAPTILDLLGYELSGQLGFGASLIRGPGYLPGKFGVE
ncbi:MAG: sulfatase-like hydrolase/transferase, partial [Desulfuromonadaceae bacterium]